jgi:hypothetical protein
VVLPVLEVGFLDGQEEPELFVQDQPNGGSMFSNDKLTYKIRHIYGGTVLVDGEAVRPRLWSRNAGPPAHPSLLPAGRVCKATSPGQEPLQTHGRFVHSCLNTRSRRGA